MHGSLGCDITSLEYTQKQPSSWRASGSSLLVSQTAPYQNNALLKTKRKPSMKCASQKSEEDFTSRWHKGRQKEEAE